MNNSSILEYKNRVLRVSKLSVYALALYLLGAITPYNAVFLGLALGAVVGLLNFLYTAWKISKIGEAAVESSIHNRPRPVFSGMLTRFATAILSIMLVYQFPEHLNVISTLIGLFTTQFIATVDGIINSL